MSYVYAAACWALDNLGLIFQGITAMCLLKIVGYDLIKRQIEAGTEKNAEKRDAAKKVWAEAEVQDMACPVNSHNARSRMMAYLERAIFWKQVAPKQYEVKKEACEGKYQFLGRNR